MTATRVYTKHGLRAHYYDLKRLRPQPYRGQTYCGHDAYFLNERNRFWRRRLSQASVCSVCDQAQNKETL